MSVDRFSLEGKTAVVTGAGGFFGRHFTRALLEHGAKVILIEKDLATLKFFSQVHEDRYESFFVDLYDRQATRDCYQRILAANQVDILVNNAFDFSARTGFNTEKGKLE